MYLLIISVLIFIINLPFGYWRGSVKKYSLRWFLAIHIPVPIIVLIRIYSGIGFDWYTYPVFITAFFLGQLAGSRFKNHL